MVRFTFTTLLLGLTLAASLGAARLNPEAQKMSREWMAKHSEKE